MPATKPVLMVIDVQKAFFEGMPEPERSMLEQMVVNVNHAIDYFRHNHGEIIFTKTIYRHDTLPKNIVTRLQQYRLPDFLAPNSNSSNFYKLTPKVEDTIIEKSSYDVFLTPDFLHTFENIKRRAIYVTGLFLDVCIDCFIRGAFQRGVNTYVISDCITTGHYPIKDVECYMEKYYSTSFITLEGLKEKNQ